MLRDGLAHTNANKFPPDVLSPPCLQKAVHESFEWNISADLRVLFGAATERVGASSHVRRGTTLIVALVDVTTTNDENRARRRRRGLAQEMEGATVGVLELSREELISCGAAGRWCPLRAFSSSSIHQGTTHDALTGGYDHVGRGIVGEALVAFAWMQKGPATDALPKAPMNHHRVGKSRKRPRGKDKGIERSRDSEGGVSKHRAEKGINNATNANAIHRSLAEHGNSSSSTSNRGSTQQETLVYIHVWDALVPLDWPGSAFYFTVRLCCRGSRVQRVSTKPACGRGGLRTNTTTAAGGNNSRSPGASTSSPRRSSRAGSMHVVWDEHLLLSVKGPVEEGAVVELLLRDASVDDGATLAAREGEPFQAFAERNSLIVGMPTTLANSCSSSSLCQLEIPGPVVYRLRLHHPRGLPEAGQSTSATEDEGAERSGVGFGGVEVRMAGLVILRDGANVDHDEARVEDFLRRKADVARIPGAVKRRLSTVGGGRGPGGFTPTLLRTQGNRRPGRRSRLLDLSAASGLFHQFADKETGGTCAVEIVNTGRSSPGAAAAAGSNMMRSPTTPGKGESMERYQCSSEPMLTDDGLRLLAKQYFPGLAHQAGYAGVDAATATLQQSSDGHSHAAATTHQASTQKLFGDSISFTGFVSWLRNLPQEDLGTAGLLVSPRTALHKTGMVMHEDAEHAQELAATLELAREPTAALFGGWCSIALRSTVDVVAMDRVRIGWGRGGGGDGDGNGNGDGDETAESAWRRHTRMLRRDVAVLGKALAEVEQRCSWCNPTAIKERKDTNTSAIGDGVGDDCDVAAEVAGATKGMEETRDLEPKREADGVPPTAENGAVAAPGGPTVVVAAAAVGQEESECCSVVALYLGQQVALLGSAAEHLKEALRCAGDTLNRNTTQTPDHHFASGGHTRARTCVEKEWSHGSSGSSQAYHHRHYGLLLQHIKQVTCFQAEIAVIQRRTTAIMALRRGEETKPLIGHRLDTGCRSYGVPCGTELPRSALALVKRIRRAQNAARRQQPLDSSSPACGGVVAGGEPLFPLSREQAVDNGGDVDCLHPSQTLENRDCLTGHNDEVTRKRLRQNRAGSPPPGNDPPAAAPGHMEGGAMSSPSPRTPTSPRAPFDDMLLRPSSLQILRRRLESIRAGFHEKAVDLPAVFSSATAERLMEAAHGGRQNTTEASTTRLVPPAALCCPIDR